MKISYYQFLLIESEDPKQRGRDETWEANRLQISQRVRNSSTVYSKFLNNDEVSELHAAHKAYINPYAQAQEKTRAQPNNPRYGRGVDEARNFLAKNTIPDKVLRPFIERKIREAAPHPKYEKAMMRWLANGSIGHLEDLSMVGERMKQHYILTQGGKLKDKTSNVYRATNPDGFREINFSIPSHMNGQQSPDTRWVHGRPASILDVKYPDKLPSSIERKKVVHSDVNTFPHYGVFNHVVGQEVDKAGRDLMSQPVEGKDFVTVHDDHEVTVREMLTHHAAKYFAYSDDIAKKASVCTAYESPFNFNNYKQTGPILTFHPKSPRYEGEWYQTHPSQTMNQDNRHSSFLDTTRTPDVNTVRIGSRFSGFNHNDRREYENLWFRTKDPQTRVEAFKMAKAGKFEK